MKAEGQCKKCDGHLGIRGQGIETHPKTGDVIGRRPAQVFCEKCGMVQTDHPLQQQFNDAVRDAEKPQVHQIPPHEYQASHGDRIKRLEQTVKDQAERIARLERAQEQQSGQKRKVG